MGSAASKKIHEINSQIAVQRNHELRPSVENFAEEAYLHSCKVDGLKLIIANVGAREAFIKFLKVECTSNNEYNKFLAEMNNIIGLNELEEAADSTSLVQQYRRESLMETDASNHLNHNIQKLLSQNNYSGPNISQPSRSSITNIKDKSEVKIFEQIVKEDKTSFSSTEATPDMDNNDENTIGELLEDMSKSCNETLTMMALNIFPKFIMSDEYKEWRIEEQECVTDITTTLCTTNEVISDVFLSQKDNYASKAALFISGSAIDRLFGTGSWLSTFISAAEGLPICVTLADADKSRPGFPLIYVNKVFETSTGYPREEIRGTNCKFLQSPKSERESITELSNALANMLPIKVTITNFKSDGTSFKNLLAMKPIFDLEGNYCYVIGVQFDITAPGANAKALRITENLITILPNVVPYSTRI
eukprot:gene1968-3822_t